MSYRILVVDDNPVNLKLASDVLEAEGYSIERARDAKEALEVINRTDLDLILMDIELPGIDGLTLTKMLKADKATREIPVIAITAFAMRGDDQKAYEAGCQGYIAKPIDTRKFPGQIAEYLKNRDKKIGG